MQKAGQICVDEMRKQKGGNEKGGRKKRERAREGDGEGEGERERGIWVAWLGDALMLMLLLHILRLRTDQNKQLANTGCLSFGKLFVK